LEMSSVAAVALTELECCTLCEHRCGVNRLAGETGVCRATTPVVASATLHPAPPSSYTVFLAGCNFKCLNCQNWSISCYPDIEAGVRGYVDPAALAAECVDRLFSLEGALIGADRIFFSGGAADIHLPYVEEVVRQARLLRPETKVNFDTNGYLIEESLERLLAFTTSVTFDIKAFDDEVHRALTGASVVPVLRNAELIGWEHADQLWEYRVLVIPEITDTQVRPICDFIASIDRALPVCFLAFRPNYVLEQHPGAGAAMMEHCLDTACRAGLTNVHRAGQTGLPGSRPAPVDPALRDAYSSTPALVAGSVAARAGCVTHPRDCRRCEVACGMRSFVPLRTT
jgi:pyruvate formate lyase activating enzyme